MGVTNVSEYPALISGDRHLQREDLNDQTARAAQGLRDMGIKPGNAVAMLVRNDFPFFEVSFAAQAVGAYSVPVNWHLAPGEMTHILEDCDAKVLIAHADLYNSLGDAVPSHIPILLIPTPPELQAAYNLDDAACTLPAGAEVWGQWLADHPPIEDRYPKVPWSMMYTSGTTGLPKGVKREMQEPEDAAKVLALRDEVYGLGPGVRSIIAGPLYHGAPNNFSTRSVQVGETLVIMPRFDAEEFLTLVEKHQICTAFMVPVMFVRLLELPDAVRQKYDLSSLRQITHAAAPCPAEVKQAMCDWMGPIFSEFYAGTEGGYWTICHAEDWQKKPGTVGRVVEDATVKTLDDDGNPTPVGEPGEIFGRLHTFSDFTYHNMPDERAKIERDGLITLGDVGYLDEDGFLFLCDRKRDMVISGGVNIYPAEIEAVLVQMDGVKDCAVFGIPDAEYGETLMAVIEPHAGVTLDQDNLTQHLRGLLAGFKVPRVMEFRESLPRGDDGKIYKRRIRDEFWKDSGRQI